MHKSVKYVALAIMLSLALGLMVSGALTERVVNKWAAAESMKTSRSGACAALLPDGRVLITGGKDDSGVLSSAEFLAGTGDAAPMAHARAGHLCVALNDATVLVAGGPHLG
jgi:hypothetical protein